jgi:hypothetical protein
MDKKLLLFFGEKIFKEIEEILCEYLRKVYSNNSCYAGLAKSSEMTVL